MSDSSANQSSSPQVGDDRPFVLRAPGGDARSLDDRVRAALSERRRTIRDYPAEEIVSISQLDRRLFPDGFEISDDVSTRFRALAALSRCELRPPREIRSHRRFIGPLIVRAKRLLYPLVALQFKESFKALQELNSWSIANQAALTVEIARSGHHPALGHDTPIPAGASTGLITPSSS